MRLTAFILSLIFLFLFTACTEEAPEKTPGRSLDDAREALSIEDYKEAKTNH